MIQDQDGQKYVIPQQIPYPPQNVAQIKDFLNLIKKYIKQVNIDIEFHGSQIKIIDYKMNERLDGEDKRYAYNPHVHNLVRRGFSIIKVGDQQPEILRQGLKKFFDIDLDNFNKNQGFKYLLHNYTFPPQLDGQVDIFVSEKANGENAQISYHQGQDAWVIASKNVTAILRNLADLQIYKKLENSQRFDWVEVIAKEWFNKLENYPNIDALKNTLNKATLIGEYCGHLDYQHLVQYQEPHLRFYALVSKDLNQQFGDTCLEVEQSLQFIQQMGLINVKIRKEQVQNKQELYKKLQELYKEISLSPLEQDGEGTVVYFQNSVTKQVISLGKLKTLEYRLKRKIREKIKNYLNQGNENLVQSYINQSKDLCKEFPDYDLGKYIELLQTSILYLNEVGQEKREYWKKNVKSFFLDFLKEVEVFQKQRQIQ